VEESQCSDWRVELIDETEIHVESLSRADNTGQAVSYSVKAVNKEIWKILKNRIAVINTLGDKSVIRKNGGIQTKWIKNLTKLAYMKVRYLRNFENKFGDEKVTFKT